MTDQNARSMPSPASRPPDTCGTATQGAQQAAAEVVALTFYASSSGPSATGSSIRPGRRSTGYTKGMLGYSQRGRVSRRASPRARPPGAMPRKLASTPARRRSKTNPDLHALRPARRRGAFPGQLRPLPRPGRAGLRRAIPTSTTTTGCGAARSKTSTRPSASAFAPDQDERTPSQMPRFGLDKLLDAGADRRRRRIRAVAVAQCEPTRPRSSGARRSSPSSAPPVTAPTARAIRSRARRTSTDAIWLYGGPGRPIVRQHPTGRGGVMPAWAGRSIPSPSRCSRLRARLGGGK